MAAYLKLATKQKGVLLRYELDSVLVGFISNNDSVLNLCLLFVNLKGDDKEFFKFTLGSNEVSAILSSSSCHVGFTV